MGQQAEPSNSGGHASSYKSSIPKLSVPSILNPFRPSAHQPPVQANSTSGEAKWYSDWKWLNPFSSSITLDENRAVLPPFRTRPPIYTFYDTTVDKDDAQKTAEKKLLLIWRRAWWAQGFRPVILSRAEAMNNPLYESLQSKSLDPVLESEIIRWLAWGHMGTGILSNWLALPMGPHDDDLLSYLRRGEYPHLTRYENLGSGFFCGSKQAINDALKKLLSDKPPTNVKSIVEALGTSAFAVDPQPKAIAFYDSNVITAKYSKVAEKLVASTASGLESLSLLINAHLHNIFKSNFGKGIAVLKPVPQYTTALVSPALRIATLLSQCPESPMPATCPPNAPKCHPCVATQPMLITQPQYFRNTSSLYTVGTVPHPYTFATLTARRGDIDTKYVRRSTDRDPWVTVITKELLGTGVSGAPRVVRLKEAIASEFGSSRSLWLVAEYDSKSRYLWPSSGSGTVTLSSEVFTELDWHFGFMIPRNEEDRGKSDTPVPGPERLPPPPKPEGPVPSPQELAVEKELLGKARDVLMSKEQRRVGILKVVEAWNLADTEAWRFARAWEARSRVERLKWEEDEKSFLGGGGSGGWGMWHD
ncbi:MAG: hypothetical protein M1834_003148 [Cirrosporium novae-zelandiae]|nr:MAG: hypothetical protein M1834_003148 [Cirrosporium novae-zelandiae]